MNHVETGFSILRFETFSQFSSTDAPKSVGEKKNLSECNIRIWRIEICIFICRGPEDLIDRRKLLKEFYSYEIFIPTNCSFKCKMSLKMLFFRFSLSALWLIAAEFILWAKVKASFLAKEQFMVLNVVLNILFILVDNSRRFLSFLKLFEISKLKFVFKL